MEDRVVHVHISAMTAMDITHSVKYKKVTDPMRTSR